MSFQEGELSFLGHMISEKGMSPNTEHVVAVTQAPPPMDASALRSFLGLTSWYSKFIPNDATVMEPLRALLLKDADFSWTGTAHTNLKG